MDIFAKYLIMFALFSVLIWPRYNVSAQAATPIECGAIIEAELTTQNGEHDYSIQLSPGDTINVNIERIGNTLKPRYDLFDSTNRRLESINSNNIEKSTVVSASGNYLIRVRSISNTIGAYILSVGCTFRNGTVISPGDIITENAGSDGGETRASVALPFSGRGFPGLAPVDFANAFQLPLALSSPVPGSMPPAGDAVLGLTFDANAGDRFALDFARTTGNLNLGLVVLSANNEVVFQASLVTLESLSARMTLPSAGQYTIGVFRIDLLPPAAPEATQFQITGMLNP